MHYFHTGVLLKEISYVAGDIRRHQALSALRRRRLFFLSRFSLFLSRFQRWCRWFDSSSLPVFFRPMDGYLFYIVASLARFLVAIFFSFSRLFLASHFRHEYFIMTAKEYYFASIADCFRAEIWLNFTAMMTVDDDMRIWDNTIMIL